MNKLLTVVIPTYNMERLLPNCLESLLHGSMAERTEILVVNDGSTDTSGRIAEEYAKKYPDIVTAIQKENGGHGSAINIGIQRASGKYFKVIDSDDTVEKAAYEAYLRKLQTIDCDLIATPFTCVWYEKQGEMEMPAKEQRRQIEGAENLEKQKIYSFQELADRLHIRIHEWTIRTELLRKHSIQLTEHSYYVDMQYILYPVPWIQTVCILGENVYRYRLGTKGQSVSMQSMQKNREQHRNVLRSLVDFYREREAAGDAKERLAYIAKGMAKMEADEVQTVLSLPIGKAAKRELLAREKYLKKECPAAYRANQKRSVWLLRFSNYMMYPLAAIAWRIIKK